MSNSHEVHEAKLQPDAVELLDNRFAQSRRAVARRHRRLLGALSRAARDTRQATSDYVAFWAEEGARWRAFAERRRAALSSPALERTVWRQVNRALGELQHRIEDHVATLDQRCLAEVATDSPPLPNYDDMNARLVVAAVKGLGDDECRAVERYEAAHKNRTTVLRAVRRRLAA